jgi:hypothetical protein
MGKAKTYSGGCHCGAVRFEAHTALESLADCNCSRCKRLGWVMQAIPASEFKLLSGDKQLTEYRFNTHAIQHLFCQTCGIESFGRGVDGQGVATVMLNVNCLDDVPPVDRTGIKHWDGASL